ncbi:MAG TPA: hypothetical protein VF323_11115 [Candidatus Limnocylindrales bacterium]
MTGQLVVRLVRCRPIRGEFDSVLRDRILPDLQRLAGVIDVHAGRHGPDATGERLVASIWESDAAMVESLGTDLESSGFHPEHLADTTDRALEVHPLAIAVRSERREPERVMRLVKGRVRAGELDAYVDDARSGTLQDAATREGPLALYLAPLPPDGFLTLSVWAEWASIEASTGAGTQRPDATRHEERLLDVEVAHYEVVPR